MIGALIGAGMGLASGIAGAVKSAKAARQQQQLIDEQNRKNEIWFNNEYYKDYMDRSDAQAAMERVRQTMQRQNNRIEQQAAVTGATPESVIAQKEANSGVITDAAAAIQANASNRQDKVMDAYKGRQDSLAGQQQQQYQMSEAGYANLANSGLSTAANIATAALSDTNNGGLTAKEIQDYGSKQAEKAIKRLNTNFTSIWNK